MKMKNDNSDLHRYIHSFCFENKEFLRSSEINVCFYCMQKVRFEDIEEWIEERSGKESAICPHCGIDSVVPYKVDGMYELDDKMLDEMHKYWFK